MNQADTVLPTAMRSANAKCEAAAARAAGDMTPHCLYTISDNQSCEVERITDALKGLEQLACSQMDEARDEPAEVLMKRENLSAIFGVLRFALDSAIGPDTRGFMWVDPVQPDRSGH